MYFNNVFIGFYVLIAFIGLIIGKFIAWCNIRIPENKKIFSIDFFKENKSGLKLNYVFMISIAIIYVFLLYKFGINKTDLFKNLDLIKFLILTPMLVLAFSIDIVHRIIPNRLNLTILELGIIITFVYGISNVNIAKDYILGMFLGAIIFGIIAGIGWVVTGKEALGIGDVKFMTVIGLYFGTNSIAEISLLAFIVAAVVSICLILIRVIIFKKKDDYIPFGPFLSMSAMLCIFLKPNLVLDCFMNFCKMISDSIL